MADDLTAQLSGLFGSDDVSGSQAKAAPSKPAFDPTAGDSTPPAKQPPSQAQAVSPPPPTVTDTGNYVIPAQAPTVNLTGMSTVPSVIPNLNTPASAAPAGNAAATNSTRGAGYAMSATPIVDPNSLTGELKDRLAQQDKAATATQDFVGEYLQNAYARAGKEQTFVQGISDARDQVTSDILDQTAAYKKTIQPMLQKNAAIADRLDQFAGMNPFARFIANVTDLGHNEGFLKEQQTALNQAITAHTAQYQNLIGVNKIALDALDKHEASGMDVFQTAAQGDESKLRANTAVFGASQNSVYSTLSEIEGNQKLVAANAALRADTLSQMTLADTNKNIAQATKNGGSIDVNGIPISLGELQKRSDDWQETNLNLQSHKMAVQSQSWALADQYQERALMSMGPAGIDSIMRNGGIGPDGTQYKMNILASAYQAAHANQSAQIELATQGGIAPVWQNGLQYLGQQFKQTQQRTQDLFGQTPVELSQSDRDLATRINALNQGMQDAFKSGGADGERAFMAAKTPELEAIINQQRSTITSVAKKWAQGHPNMQALAESHITGSPLNAETAASALIEMGRFGVGTGTAQTPSSARAHTDIANMVRDWDNTKDAQATAGQRLTPDEKSRTGKEDPGLIKEVTDYLQKNHLQDTNTWLLHNTGTVASTMNIMGPDGKPMPGSQMDPRNISAAQIYGDKKGLADGAKSYGMSTDQLTDVMVNGAKSQAYVDYQKRTSDKSGKPSPNQVSAATMQSDTLGRQTQALLDGLRAGPEGQKGFDPAAALSDLWVHPQFQKYGMANSQAQGNRSIGDYGINQVAGANYSTGLLNYADTLRQSLHVLNQTNIQQATDAQRRLRVVNPRDTAYMAAHSLEGLNAGEANSLMDYVMPRANDLARQQNISGSDAIDSIITKTKFDDPYMEKIRATAAKDWMRNRKVTSDGIGGFLATIGQGISDAATTHVRNMAFYPPTQDMTGPRGLVTTAQSDQNKQQQ